VQKIIALKIIALSKAQAAAAKSYAIPLRFAECALIQALHMSYLSAITDASW